MLDPVPHSVFAIERPPSIRRITIDVCRAKTNYRRRKLTLGTPTGFRGFEEPLASLRCRRPEPAEPVPSLGIPVLATPAPGSVRRITVGSCNVRPELRCSPSHRRVSPYCAWLERSFGCMSRGSESAGANRRLLRFDHCHHASRRHHTAAICHFPQAKDMPLLEPGSRQMSVSGAVSLGRERMNTRSKILLRKPV
jgi:hypothetical protein